MKKQKTQNVKNTNKGITLIALVITIIVMLILVAVTINMAVNGGLFNYAGKATEDTKNAINKEQQLANLEANMTVDQLIDKYTGSQEGTGNGGTESEVIPEPAEGTYYRKFGVGDGVTAYLVANGTTEDGETLYDMLIIKTGEGTGEMSDPGTWDTKGAITYEEFSGGEYNVTYNVEIINVIISKGVTTISSSAFCTCTSLKNVVIPQGVTSIGYRSFDRCTRLSGVVIPDGVETVGMYAFRTCSGLTSMTLPANLNGYSSDSFDGCYSLEVINFRGSEEQWPINKFAYGYSEGNGYLYLENLEDLTINYNYNG